MPEAADNLQWRLQIEVDSASPGKHWKTADWRRTHQRARSYWSSSLRSDFQHVWESSRLPYARELDQVQRLAAALQRWRKDCEAVLMTDAFGVVKLVTFRVALIGIWDEEVAIIDVLADTVEWYGADMHY